MTAADGQVSSSPAYAPTTPSKVQQLGRRKRNKERVRVTRACDRCKTRKIKCNGTQPCGFCMRAKASCTFDSAYKRGRAPSIPSVPDADCRLQAAVDRDDLGHGDSITVSRQAFLDQEGHISPSYLTPSTSEAVNPAASSRSSPDPSQTDLQGHYIGPASGVSFLLRIQKRLHQAISFSQGSSIFTFGDASLHLPEFDPSFCMMLPREDAQRLVDRYFDFSMPTYRFIHRPTLQEWFDEFYDSLGVLRDTTNAPAKIALLFMVFSLGRVYMPDNDRPGPPDLSTRYYLAAEHQLRKEKGLIRLTSIQARLAQCHYLLTQSRINHCWSLFGTVSRLALAIGLNRKRHPDPTSVSSRVEVESSRRTFWCAYTLDAYLSAALGRPRSLQDDDIDTELPSCVDDEDLMMGSMQTVTTSKNGPSKMLATLAHVKIARIIGRILRHVYSIKPVSTSQRVAAVKSISMELSDWRQDIAWFLDIDTLSASLCIPIFQRQRNVLNLTYWHAVILTHRPFVLNSFSLLSQKTKDSEDCEVVQAEESVKQCLDAAMKTVTTIDELTRTHQMFRSFWITAYIAFNATIILYIYVIHKRDSPAEVYGSYLLAAARCQSQIASIASKGSLTERYCLVLEELRLEALRQTGNMQGYLAALEGGMNNELHRSDINSMSMALNDATTSGDVNYVDFMGEATAELDGSVHGVSLGEYADWGHFTSMVSSGLGNMDSLLFDDLSMI